MSEYTFVNEYEIEQEWRQGSTLTVRTPRGAKRRIRIAEEGPFVLADDMRAPQGWDDVDSIEVARTDDGWWVLNRASLVERNDGTIFRRDEGIVFKSRGALGQYLWQRCGEVPLYLHLLGELGML